MDIVERLYGQHIQFHFDRKVVEELLNKERYYPEDVKKRVEAVLVDRKRKFGYLF